MTSRREFLTALFAENDIQKDLDSDDVENKTIKYALWIPLATAFILLTFGLMIYS